MATLALAAAGAAVGGALLPAGVSILGATLTGAAIGAQVGALAGSVHRPGAVRRVRPVATAARPAPAELRVTASSEGADIPRLYGRARLGGQVIWATNFEEEVYAHRQRRRRQGRPRRRRRPPRSSTATSPISPSRSRRRDHRLGRVWADGEEIDLSTVTYRLHPGSDDKPPDSLIEAKEGAGNAPAYRGIAYVVFERLALADFGNRLPQLSFEVHRAVDTFEQQRARRHPDPRRRRVHLPRHVPSPQGRRRHQHPGERAHPPGRHRLVRRRSISSQATLPNVGAVSLFVGWFGTDLRAGNCEIRPGVDTADKVTAPLTWRVAGLTRATRTRQLASTAARPMAARRPTTPSSLPSRPHGARPRRHPHAVPVHGHSLRQRARRSLHRRGGSRPTPGAAASPSRPHPASPASPDQTAAAATQVDAFVGTAAPADFSIVGDTVIYSGPDEWSYRRFILHYAHLGAGGRRGRCLRHRLARCAA